MKRKCRRIFGLSVTMSKRVFRVYREDLAALDKEIEALSKTITELEEKNEDLRKENIRLLEIFDRVDKLVCLPAKRYEK